MASLNVRTLVIGALALAGPTIVDRLYPLYLFYNNRPSALQHVNVFSKHQVKWADEIRNCEDVVLDEARGTAFFSCDPGRDRWNTVMGTFINATEVTGSIYYYKYSKHDLTDGELHSIEIEDMDREKWLHFHPLGLGYWPATRTLYVVNHGEIGHGIDVFTVNKEATKLTFNHAINHALVHTPNSVLPISDHEIYFTNDHAFRVRDNPIIAKLETYVRIAKGSVVYMNLKTNEAKTVANLAFANGIARLNDTHIAVASTTGLSVHVFEMTEDRDLVHRQKIFAGYWVDNLRVDSNGKLLIAGHPHSPTLEKVAKTNHLYRLDRGRLDGLDPAGRPRAPSWVSEWDGNVEGRLRILYLGDEFGASTTVVRDVGRGVGFVVGLYEKGVMQFVE